MRTEQDLKDILKNNPALRVKEEVRNWRDPAPKTQPKLTETPARYYTQVEEDAMSEAKIQSRFFDYLKSNLDWQPLFALFYAIPNGSNKSKVERYLFQLTGLKAGVPDVHCPIARQNYHSLYIEFKKKKTGKVSDEQAKWFAHLRAEGNKVVIADNLRYAITTVKDYLGIPEAD